MLRKGVRFFVSLLLFLGYQPCLSDEMVSQPDGMSAGLREIIFPPKKTGMFLE